MTIRDEINKIEPPSLREMILTGQRPPDLEAGVGRSLSPEMKRALEADGEKLRQLTGVPVFERSERLAEPRPDCGAIQMSDQVLKSIDNAAVHIVNELDQLTAGIERLKAKVIEDSAAAKAAVAAHFHLGAEALAFRDKVHKRLDELTK
jgi:hypothetical protein